MVPPAPIRISYLDNLQMHLGTAASTTVLSLGAAPTSITVLQPGLGGLFPIACMIILYTQVYSIHIYACTVVVIAQLGMPCGECLSVLIESRLEHGHLSGPTQSQLVPTKVKAISSPSISLRQGESAIDHRRGQACEFDGDTICD